MTRTTQQTIALAVAVPAAIVLTVAAGMLISGALIARHKAPIDKRLLETLQQKIGNDVSQVPALAAELDRQTKASLSRVEKQKTLTIVLIVAAVLFLAGAKWRIVLTEHPPLLPDSLAAMRARSDAGADDLPPPSPTHTCATSSPADNSVDLRFVEDVVAQHGRSSEAAIPILQAIQTHYRYLPDEALKRVCELTDISPAQIAGVSSFYAQFRRSPVGEHIIKVCHGTACHVAGADQITDEIRRHLRIAPAADTDPHRLFTVDKVACLGCCSLAPVIMIDETTAGKLTPARAIHAVEAARREVPV